MFPEENTLIARYEKIIRQEQQRQPGSIVENRSFKVDGWGYAMLRGPGFWDRRMETLLASKHLKFDLGDHVSRDCLGLCLFAHGALLTPDYGYHWMNDVDLLVNRVRIDGQEAKHIWGDFLHFDDHPQMPSAVAATDMCTTRSTTPGLARQQRWCVQLKEYLLDVDLIRPRDGKEHRCQWGFRNLGEVSIATPAGLTLQPAVNADGSPGTRWVTTARIPGTRDGSSPATRCGKPIGRSTRET